MGEIELGAAAEATIQAYRELAADPSKRLALALDRTCIQFLAYVVAEGESTLVHLAIETLSLIAQAKECRPSLANTFGVLESLQAVTEDEEIYSEEIRTEAAGLFTSLQFARCLKRSLSPNKADAARTSTDKEEPPKPEVEEPPKSDDVDSSKDKEEVKGTSKTERVGSPDKSDNGSVSSPSRCDVKTESPRKNEGSESSRRSSSVDSRSLSVDETSRGSKTHPLNEKRGSFLGSNNSKAKIVTLFVRGMVSPEHRKQIEEELVRVRGLISIVFDMGHSRVTCRVKRDLSVEKLAAAVARTDIPAVQQVTINLDGEEVLVPLGGDQSEAISPVDDLPDYLPEEDGSVKDIHSAVAPSGSFKETATTWFTTASSLLQKSFYW